MSEFVKQKSSPVVQKCCHQDFAGGEGKASYKWGGGGGGAPVKMKVRCLADLSSIRRILRIQVSEDGRSNRDGVC